LTEDIYSSFMYSQVKYVWQSVTYSYLQARAANPMP